MSTSTPIPPSDTAPSLTTLVQRHQALIAWQRNAFTLRMHRALSWLQRAEAAGNDDDMAFICLWIAFNAAYAQDTGGTDSPSERQTFRDFVGQVCHLDANKALSALVWQVFPGPIRVLLGNSTYSSRFGMRSTTRTAMAAFRNTGVRPSTMRASACSVR